MSDLISRQEVIIALRESGLCYNNWLEVLGVIDAVPNAKEHIKNGELIRRQDVLNMIIVAGECEPDLGYTHLHKVIENLPSAEPKTGEWIPVSERLPDLHKTVIYSLGVETYDGETYTGYRTDRNYSGEVVEPYWADMETGIEVFPNAWMPLPKPYKGGDSE